MAMASKGPSSKMVGGGGVVWTALLFIILFVQITLIIFSSSVDATPSSNSNANAAGSASTQSCVVNPTTASNTGSQKVPVSPLPSDEEERETAAEVCEKKQNKKKKKTTGKTKPNDSKSKKKSVATTTSSASSSSSLSTTQSVFVRRIQSEWREAVKMGVAYDWVEGKPITKKTKKNKKEKNHDSSSTTNPDATAATAESENNDGGGGVGGLDGEQKKQQQHHHQYFCLGPLGNNLFVWDFTFLGMENSMYDGGLYHGRLILPPQYPSSPPRVQVWTPSGRFVPGADICLSASAFHPETWNPAAFNLRTIIESLRLHMMTPPTEIGGTKATPEKKQELAKDSRTWKQSLTVKPSKKSGYAKIVEIDHSKMIKQGVFPSLTDLGATEEEEEAGNATTTSPAFGLEDVLTEYLEEVKEAKTMNKGKDGKTKKKRKGKKLKSKSTTKAKESVSAKESESTGLIFLTAKTTLNNRLIRMAILFFIIFKVVFG